MGNKSGDIESSAVTHGMNAEVTAYSDKKYVHCKQCGFPCHLDRDARSASDREKYAENGTNLTDNTFTTTDGDGNSNSNYIDPTVVSGCPLCGSHRYV